MSSVAATKMTLPIGPKTMDHDFFEMARDIPAFGGAYRDPAGAWTTYVTDLSAAAAAEAALQQRYLIPRGYTVSSTRAVKGEYNWIQLFEWRQSIDELLDLPGVVQTDIDESRNRIVVGIASESARSAVLSDLPRRGIPLAAVEFTAAGYPVPDAALTSTLRPVTGGLQIKNLQGGKVSNPCTIGFNGLSNSLWMVTNSHCSSTSGVADGMVNTVPWYQAEVTAANFIATEQIDPPFFTGGSCPAGLSCRWSDASVASYGTGNVVRGRIKRTSGPNNGSLTIVGEFRIIEERAYPDKLMVLNKVGRTTGWTQGTVQQTCVNTTIGDISNRRFLCQDKVSYGSTGGDSGSPVFRILSGNDVQLIGIHWGRDGIANLAIMSAMTNIEFETIPLNTCDPAIPAHFCT